MKADVVFQLFAAYSENHTDSIVDDVFYEGRAATLPSPAKRANRPISYNDPSQKNNAQYSEQDQLLGNSSPDEVMGVYDDEYSPPETQVRMNMYHKRNSQPMRDNPQGRYGRHGQPYLNSSSCEDDGPYLNTNVEGQPIPHHNLGYIYGPSWSDAKESGEARHPDQYNSLPNRHLHGKSQTATMKAYSDQSASIQKEPTSSVYAGVNSQSKDPSRVSSGYGSVNVSPVAPFTKSDILQLERSPIQRRSYRFSVDSGMDPSSPISPGPDRPFHPISNGDNLYSYVNEVQGTHGHILENELNKDLKNKTPKKKQNKDSPKKKRKSKSQLADVQSNGSVANCHGDPPTQRTPLSPGKGKKKKNSKTQSNFSV